MKNKIIAQIKEIIRQYGSFSTADVQAESSPCVNSLGKSSQLAETFYNDKVELIIYVNDEESSSDFVTYEELKINILKEILKLAKDYQKQEEIV